MKNAMRLLIFLIISLSGCAVGPDYHRPTVDGWKQAEPDKTYPPTAWWENYHDPILNQLVPQIVLSNQNIQAAEARYRQANALLQSSQAGRFPLASAKLSSNRSQVATTQQADTSNKLSLSASWEADLWGGIRRNIESNTASAQASQADLQAALISAQAALAQAYFQWQANVTQQRLLEQTIASYERSLEITRDRHQAGIASRSDVTQAQAQLNSTQTQAIDLGIQKAQLEHAIAVLIGKPPQSFSLSGQSTMPAAPAIPIGIPSELLERRPDIAAAERRVAAANAHIGIAQAALYPSFTLSASSGYQHTSFAQLLSLPNHFWSLGATLTQTLFDGGLRSAQKAQDEAAYDQAVALYRQTALTAFQEVEDNLATLNILVREAETQKQVVRATAETLSITQYQYSAGTLSYLNVASAQAAALLAERTYLELTTRRLLASVALFKALGGGWI